MLKGIASMGIVLIVVATIVIGLGSFMFVDWDSDGLRTLEELQRGTGIFSSDSDGDGLDDGREVELGTNPTLADSDGDGLEDGRELECGTDPMDSDSDDDGLNDGKEVLEIGTSPVANDTDGDGLGDGEEVHTYGSDPMRADTDADGLDDGYEVSDSRTSPLNPDTDGDGLGDGLEVRTYKTNPLVADTDGDGLKDGEEVTGWAITVNGTIKLVSSSPTSLDTDSDGLDDRRERSSGTDPRAVDTDEDELSDFQEIEGWYIRVALVPFENPHSLISDAWRCAPNPTLTDSDGDGLSDGEEHSVGTDPCSADTDNDFVPDRWEVDADFLNPTDARDVVVPYEGNTIQGDHILMQFVNYPIGYPSSAQLRSAMIQMAFLDRVYAWMESLYGVLPYGGQKVRVIYDVQAQYIASTGSDSIVLMGAPAQGGRLGVPREDILTKGWFDGVMVLSHELSHAFTTTCSNSLFKVSIPASVVESFGDFGSVYTAYRLGEFGGIYKRFACIYENGFWKEDGEYWRLGGRGWGGSLLRLEGYENEGAPFDQMTWDEYHPLDGTNRLFEEMLFYLQERYGWGLFRRLFDVLKLDVGIAHTTEQGMNMVVFLLSRAAGRSLTPIFQHWNFPLYLDSDGDGLSDGEEIDLWRNPFDPWS